MSVCSLWRIYGALRYNKPQHLICNVS